MDDLLDGIEPLSEQLRPGMWQRQSFIFISSRAAYTPFHFDPHYNFFLQVRGDKIIYMWDPTDRDVLPYASIDKYYAERGKDSYADWASIRRHPANCVYGSWEPISDFALCERWPPWAAK